MLGRARLGGPLNGLIHSAHAKLDSLKLQMSSRGSDFKALVMTLPLRPQSVEEGDSRCDASPVPVPVVTEGVARPPLVHPLPTWAEFLTYLVKVRYTGYVLETMNLQVTNVGKC